jgi:hypothetical protein
MKLMLDGSRVLEMIDGKAKKLKNRGAYILTFNGWTSSSGTCRWSYPLSP